MQKINFVKMVGAGNDFIVIEPVANLDYIKFTQAICARQTGVGADGVLIAEQSQTSDYRMRIINADGSEAEMCGNGARCLASYIVTKFNPSKKLFGMETLAGEVLAEVNGEEVRVRLSNPKDYKAGIDLTVAGQQMRVDYIDTGVPHAVAFMEGLQTVDVNTIGRLIRHHASFAPRGTNANFAEMASSDAGRMVVVRTYERGVEAETLACGTGSVATAIIAYLRMHPTVKEQKGAAMRVLTASKEVLEVGFDLSAGNKIDNVWLKGTAKVIAKGEYFYHG